MKKKLKTYVVIGNSAAGLSAIESIRQIDQEAKIINISQEPHRPYSRCLLSYYLSGLINKERLWIRPQDYYKKHDVEPLFNTIVESIDVKNKKISVDSGDGKVKQVKKTKVISYDELLVATGASAKGVGIKGEDKRGVFVLRTLDDADKMLGMMETVSDVAILGGGLIGMRAAYALKKRNKNVNVFVKSSHIFSQMLDYESADILKRHLEDNGINILTGVEAKEICGNGKVKSIILDNNTQIPCQMVVIGKGVSANIRLLKDQIKTDTGILVNEELKTSQSDIYAAGDVAQTFDILQEKNLVNAVWPAAVRQGKIAGLNMAGKKSLYEGSCGMNSVDFFGLSAISFGNVRPQKDQGIEELAGAEFGKNMYRKIVLRNDRVVGGIFVNDVERIGVYLHLALQKIDVSSIKELLVDEYFDYAKIMPLIKSKSKEFKSPEYQDTVFTYEPLSEIVPRDSLI